MDSIILISLISIPTIGCVIGYIVGRYSEKYRNRINFITTGLLLVVVSFLYKVVIVRDISVFIPNIMGTGLDLKLDAFRYIFVWITAFVWFLCIIYSRAYLIKYKNRNRYYAFFMLTLSSTIGIFISNNLLNLFTFFEIMSFTSYVLIIHDQDKYSLDAGKTYLSMAIGAGLVLLMGLFLLFDYTQTLNIDELPLKVKTLGNIRYVISFLILVGFGAKASIFPLHIWLPKAHPAAPTPASAVLSGILIKAGIFGMIIVVNIMMDSDYLLSMIIIGLGLINMFFGGFMAMFQRNIKRILAYSSMSQAGYITLGIGLVGVLHDKQVAIIGVLYHVFNHGIFKVLLFLTAGVIYMILHELSINKIRGFGKNKKLLKVIFLVGLFAIIGFPGFNGFISKTILHEALAEAAKENHNIFFIMAEIIFYLASAFTTAYLLKIFMFVFVEKNEKFTGQYKEQIKKRAIIPMIILAVVVIYVGLNPNSLKPLLSRALKMFGIKEIIHLNVYSLESIKSSLFVTALGVLIYYLFIQKFLLKGKTYVNPTLKCLSLEADVYKPVLTISYHISAKILHVFDTMIVEGVTFIAISLKKLSQVDIEPINKKISKKTKELLKNINNTSYIIEEGTQDSKENLSRVISNSLFTINNIGYSILIFALTLGSILFIIAL
ncbi:complex I subunit 5 family protein [Abyssisolibacter fermentans]|uniref:complex I subunit 5 family protein n=1 Tax=Abyssisolibacter fermentans TaxID=1766203 RepID=UPI0008318594|nr:proton-conducting transporter membrane subunit [Abyssisolibacter fermentans]